MPGNVPRAHSGRFLLWREAPVTGVTVCDLLLLYQTVCHMYIYSPQDHYYPPLYDAFCLWRVHLSSGQCGKHDNEANRNEVMSTMKGMTTTSSRSPSPTPLSHPPTN